MNLSPKETRHEESTQASAPVEQAEIAWQHMDAVRQFLEDTARTNSKDRDDWAEDVHLAINMLVRPPAEASAPQVVEPVAWVRFCSDGAYEGPIATGNDARRAVYRAMLSAAPTAQASAQPAADDLQRARLIAHEAQRFADDRTHLGAKVYVNDLAWALRVLAAQPAAPRHFPGAGEMVEPAAPQPAEPKADVECWEQGKPDSIDRAMAYEAGTWFQVQSVDEMQRFYRSRLPAIREAAREHGYAIGVHGSERRDFDLIACAWRDGASDPDTLAHAVAMAACGITRNGTYDWTKKPLGRIAVSIPVCWTARKGVTNDGHIDLSVAAAQPAAEPRWCSCEPTRCEGLGKCRWHAMGYAPPPAAEPGAPSSEERVLRRLLALKAAEHGTYFDDGELHDCTREPFIDFKRDPAEQIEAKLMARARAKWAALATPTPPSPSDAQEQQP